MDYYLHLTSLKTKDQSHKVSKRQSWLSKNPEVLAPILMFYYFMLSLSVGSESNMLLKEKVEEANRQ